MGGKPGTLVERFERHSVPEPNTGCWIWLGAAVPPHYKDYEYGRFENDYAHRISYKLYKGAMRDSDSNIYES